MDEDTSVRVWFAVVNAEVVWTHKHIFKEYMKQASLVSTTQKEGFCLKTSIVNEDERLEVEMTRSD